MSDSRSDTRARSIQELDLSLALRADAVLERVDPSAAERVADLGCATGTFAARVARAGPAVTAVDISEENLAHLRRLHGDLVAAGRLIPVRAELTELPLETESFDLVFCLEVLEHVEDDRAALREIARVLRHGGQLVLSVPNRAAPKPLVERLGLPSVHAEEGPERHVREGYRADELGPLLLEAGLRPTWVRGVGGPLFRMTSGVVSLAHLGYRRARGQSTWTWADVEHDAASPLMRAYARLFPALVSFVRLEREPSPEKASTLVVGASREISA